jgi:hypothetical protein
MGAGSCSAVACHGSIGPVTGSSIARNEHTIWITDDPHSRAYQVLLDPRSEQIVRNLASGHAEHVPAYRDARCLACHTTPRSELVLAVTRAFGSDGVGCESCHGPAERWIGPHTTASWQGLDAATKARDYGFRETKALRARAEVCTGCHVGQFERDGLPRRDVNHDLIAAGHPRLAFEFSAFLDRYPVHWVEKADIARPSFPARAWAVGQIVTAHAALELLRDRASDAGAPWPEFAEYGCFSCHQSLREAAWRGDLAVDPSGTGRPQWGTWPMPMLRELARMNETSPAWNDVLQRADRLGTAMRRLGGDRKDVASQANAAASSLSQLGPGDWGLDQVLASIARWNSPDSWQSSESWDAAAGRYLALVPMLQAWSSLDPSRSADQSRLRAELEANLRNLRFPSGFESPRGFAPSALPVRP